MKRQILFLAFILLSINLFSQNDLKNNETNRRFDASLFPNGIKSINVYSKDECGRCHNVLDLLKSDSIPFVDYDLNDQKIYSEIDSKIMNSLPYKNSGYSISFPVIEIDSVVFFNLENHIEFVNDLKEFIQKGKQ